MLETSNRSKKDENLKQHCTTPDYALPSMLKHGEGVNVETRPSWIMRELYASSSYSPSNSSSEIICKLARPASADPYLTPKQPRRSSVCKLAQPASADTSVTPEQRERMSVCKLAQPASADTSVTLEQ